MAAAQAFTWGDGGEQLTPEASAARRRLALAMLTRDEGQPMGWAQGLAQGVNRVIGAMMLRRAEQGELAMQQAGTNLLLQHPALSGGNPAATPGMNVPSAAAPTSPAWPGETTSAATPGGTARQLAWPSPANDTGNNNYANAIASIESGGRYDLLGPVTRTGDRAIGKYQVMGNNVGPWTQAALGYRMTPEQFRASPQAQDAVFNHIFGGYVKKYGPEGAARAWFAGEGGMNDMGRKDQLGTSVAAYGQKFARNIGGNQQPVQVASLAPFAPQDQPVQVEQQAAMSQAEPSWQDAASLPNFAPPAQSSGVARVAQAMSQGAAINGLEPRMAAYIRSLIANPHTRAAGVQMLQEASKPPHYGFQTLPDGTIVKTDPRTGNVTPAYQGPTRPTFGDIGVDPMTGQPVKGFIDPSKRSVEPYTPPTLQPGNSVVPPPPPGVDPKVWREQHSKAATADSLPPSFEDTSKLRKEVQDLPSYKNIAQAAPVYKSMLDAAGRDNRAADVNLIYGMAKIMDPGSVVRESEMTVAQAVATLPQQLRATVDSQLKGNGRLSPEVRAAIMQEAHSRIAAYQSMFDQDATMYRGIAKGRRMNDAEIIPSFGPFDEYKPAGNTTKSGVQWRVVK